MEPLSSPEYPGGFKGSYRIPVIIPVIKAITMVTNNFTRYDLSTSFIFE
jgi:hypothetical protein